MCFLWHVTVVVFTGCTFWIGHIERKYIEVPLGASWVEATMRTSGFDTARKFFVDTVQIVPLKRPIKWESVVTFSSPSARSFAFPVEGGRTMELAIAQFWSSGIGSHETTAVDFEIGFHGININKEEVVLDGSEAPIRIEAQALLSSEKLVPAAILNKIRVPYRPIEAKLSALPTSRDKLPSGKQILGLTLTYKFKLEDGAEIKPQIPLLNNRIYDTKFESQFYMISDSNKIQGFALGEEELDWHDNVQYLEKMKQLVLFIERKLEEKVSLMFATFVMVNMVETSIMIFPIFLQNCPAGSLLLGAISYGKLSLGIKEEAQKNPVSYQISCLVPPNKLDEDKGKGSSPTCIKSVSERLEEEVRDAKIKFFASLKQDTEEERSEWKELSTSLKLEYPKYTPLLAKILEGLLSKSSDEDKIRYNEEVIDAANEVVDSIDTDELTKYFSVKSDPEDDEAEKIKKKMEATRDQLAEALYQKGLALAGLEFLKVDIGGKELVGTATVSTNDLDRAADEPVRDSVTQPDLFEENFKELKKWVDVKSSKYGMLLVIRERRCGRLGTALKVLNDMIQDDGDPPKKKLYDQKLSLLDEIGWGHVASYERQWMHVHFPKSLPLF
ncbi:hypothetical protein HHK36_028958 [Tetracentron sinense]|uniref:Tripeptidyl peptidase II Ig-like domain-containing protein n=1 Tax=Tetracentron sinense TaxID=13715 RepID=A0A834YFZ0_TETSI|nr:hypothetical protein HHK36_028958 [Tetracentron sinense]